MASVKVIIRNDKTNSKSGLAPLYLRIIKDRKTKFISLGVKIEPKFWNEEKMTVKKGATNYQDLNNFIIQKRAEAEKASIELEAFSENVTSLNIKTQIKERKPSNFFDFADKKVSELKYTVSVSTLRGYQHQLKKFERFFGNRNLKFHEIDANLIKRYEHYLYKEIGNNQGTVGASLKKIRAIFNFAINEGLVNNSLYPFKNYQIKSSKAVKNYLNEEQFQSLLNFEKKVSEKQSVYYDMFVFSCYAGGLRFSDVLDMKWNEYIEKEQRIVKLIKKSQRKHQFKLPTKAISIIEKYKTKDIKQTDYIFPHLRNDFNYNIAPEIIFKEKHKYNELANNVLSEIATELKLPFNLTFHTARHTFATRALNKGMRIEHVSKILDHSNISITQIYAKIVNKELDKAMDMMND